MAVTQKEAEGLIAAAEALLAIRDHPGWKILMRQLKDERESARDGLCAVDPNDAVKIEGLQRLVHRYDWIEQTVDELIQQAVNTEILTEDEDDGESKPQPQPQETDDE